MKMYLKKTLAIIVCIMLMTSLAPKNLAFAEAKTETIVNPGFEDKGGSKGMIPGWEIIYNADSLTVTNSEKNSGKNSLEMIDTGATQSPAIKSSTFPVAKGDKISTSFFAKVNSNNNSAALLAMVQFEILDVNGNNLGYTRSLDIETATGPDVWNSYTTTSAEVTFDGAVSARIMISGGGSTQVQAYFDDFTVTRDIAVIPPTPQLSENVLINYNCSILKNLADHEWFVCAPGAGAYTTDATNSTGKPDGVSFKTVPDGQTLFYMDSTAGTDAIDAFKVVDETNKINEHPWKLDLALKFNDIMKVSTGNVLSGFSVMINTGTRVNRINFGGDNKIRVETAWADPYPTCIEKDADLHIGDGKFYKWGIAGDGKGGISITCDGNVVAEFSNVAYMDNYEPGIQFINYNNGISSNTNEIYFDNIKLTVYHDATSIINTRFENDVNADGTIPGWVRDDGATEENLSIIDAAFNSGSKCLKLYDSGAGCAPWFFSNAIDVAAGDNISLSSWVKVESGIAELSIKFMDSNENVVSYKDLDLITKPSPNDWRQETITGVVPAGATKACVFIWSGNAAAATAYYDDISLRKVAPASGGTGIKVGTPIDLGEMVKAGSPLDLYSIIAKNPATGEEELYTGTTGSSTDPSVFYVLDPSTGAVKWSQAIPGMTHLYGIVQGSDKNIYFANVNDGILYRYSPTEHKIDSMGQNPCSTWIWDLVASNDGKIYGSTSVNGKIFEYDIATKVFKDLGSVKEGVKDVRGIGVTDEFIYAGIGCPDAVYKINRKTLEKTEITTTSTGDPERMGAHVWIYNNRLFIRDCAMRLHVMDATTEKEINRLSFQQAISAPSPYNNNILYYKSLNALWEYDFDTNIGKKVENSPYLSDATSNSLSWFTPTSGPKSGRHLLGITDDAGGYVVYDPVDNTVTNIRLDTNAQAVTIGSIERGPDGRLYIGGYQYGLCIYDINGKKIDYLEPKMNQPDTTGFLNGKTYFGTYGSARIYEYDPLKPTNYSYETGGNPGLVHDIGNSQDRVPAMLSAEDKLFIGTIPDYGLVGGALTVYDSKTGIWTEYRNVVQDQSVVSLAYKDGKLYGGTSIDGGSGCKITAEEAKIFVWDVLKGEKIGQELSINIPGLKSRINGVDRTKPVMIGQLSFGPDGLLWGVADSVLFAMDVSTHEIVKSKVIAEVDYDNDSAWRPYFLRWGADGLLYSTIGRRLVVVDTKTMAYDVFGNDYIGLATLGNDGNVYYANGGRLMQLPIIRDAAMTAIFQRGTALNAAIDGIDLLPACLNITLDYKATVQTARERVNQAKNTGILDSEITNLQKLIDCEIRIQALEESGSAERLAAIKAAVDAIAALPTDIQLTNKAEVAVARNLVNTAKAKGALEAEITNLGTLIAAEAKITELEKTLTEKTAAIKAAVDAIAALPADIQLTNKAEVVAARNLVETAKTKGAVEADITNLSTLVAAEMKIAELEKVLAEKTAAIKAAVDAIAALPANIRLTNKNQVIEARSLVDAAKAKGAVDADITNLSVLVAAEEKIAQLEALAEKTAAINAAINAIAALPSPARIELTDKDDVEYARSLVEAAKVKGVVDADITNLRILLQAEDRITKLEKKATTKNTIIVVVNRKNSANIYAGANTKSKVIASVKFGTKLVVQETVGNWYKVIINGKIGFIEKASVK